MDAKESLLNQIKAKFDKQIDTRYIERDFEIGSLSTEQALKLVYELVDEGELVFVGKNKYAPYQELGFLKGKIFGTEKSYAFLTFDDQSQSDLFITPRDLNGAMHGDVVLAKKKKLTSKDGAVVFRIISRGYEKLVGTYKKFKGFAIVTPDEKRFGRDVFVKSESSKHALDGEKVVVKITDYSNERGKIEGKIVEVLGDPSFAGVDVLSVARSHNLYEVFPDDVEEEALKLPSSVDLSQYKNRKKFEENVVTIDGEDARDFDDAICLVKEKDNFRLFVHIADVSNYVTEGSKLDSEAYKRGTSVYFPNLVLPMLPKKLSNGICSLNPNVYRLTLTCEMLFDKNANLIDGKLYESVIKSQARMTYDEVTKIFAGDHEMCQKYSGIVPMLEEMNELSKMLIKKREKRGAVDFEIPEPYIKVDEKGKTVDIVKRPREDSHKLIESFMIVANEFVAKKFFELKAPFVYRIHEKPSMPKVDLFASFCAGLGETFKFSKEDDVTNFDFQNFLNQIAGKPYENVINNLALRTMQKARYDTLCIGHFGLASQFYCHFTSPIRRYPDLAIHRIIKKYLANELPGNQTELEKMKDFASRASVQSSSRERLAEEAEREVDDMKKAEFMEQFVGASFEGVISGVQNFGVFVELENTCEGLCRIENLAQGTYEFVEKQVLLKGTTKSYRLGDKIKVKLISANAYSKKIEFAEDFGQRIISKKARQGKNERNCKQ